jgi:hypothetical protein
LPPVKTTATVDPAKTGHTLSRSVYIVIHPEADAILRLRWHGPVFRGRRDCLVDASRSAPVADIGGSPPRDDH